MSIISRLVNYIDRNHREHKRLASLVDKDLFKDKPSIDNSGVTYGTEVETKVYVSTLSPDKGFMRTDYCSMYIRAVLVVGLNETTLNLQFSFFPYNGFLKQDQKYWHTGATLSGSRYPFTYIEHSQDSVIEKLISAVNDTVYADKTLRKYLEAAVAVSAYTPAELAAGRKYLEDRNP